MSDDGGIPPAEVSITQMYREMHRRCEGVLDTSLLGVNGELQAKSHLFVSELDTWGQVLSTRAEGPLLHVVAKEYEAALLALSQGHYRAAFKALRLVIELTLQAVYLSAYRLELQEWIEGRRDTEWSTLKDPKNGVLSPRFAQAFFPELGKDVLHLNSLADKLYRECSEYVHGNLQQSSNLPSELCFDGELFAAWHKSADVAARVLSFALSLRYLRELGAECRTSLETALMTRLGHLGAVRRQFGHEGGA
jgi:hypothetical protein